MKYIVIFAVGALLAAAAVAQPLDAETRCLAQNVYWEARGESWQGQVAVALVTMNRAKDHRFPKTICQVVYQPDQFSWTRSRAKITEPKAWQEAVFIAELTLTTLHKYTDFSALYFHNNRSRPHWARHKKPVARIGKHTFYR